MGRNYIEGTSSANMMKWGANAEFKEALVEVKRRGRKVGGRNALKTDDPRTPFEALRMLLNLRQDEWSRILDTTQSAISHTERGGVSASVPLAKRMQEEARQRGVAVTLDELYQHVLPYRYVIRDGQLKKESEVDSL